MRKYDQLNSCSAEGLKQKAELLHDVCGPCGSPEGGAAFRLGVCIWQAACVLGEFVVAAAAVHQSTSPGYSAKVGPERIRKGEPGKP